MATIKSFNKRLQALRSERASFIPIYQDLSDYHLAHRGRFLQSNENKGNQKRNLKQINNTSRLAVRTLASGMMAGITSPARPWFKLAAPDPDMNEYTSVKEWLHKVQFTMNRVFNSSNIYNSLHTMYGELGVFGTAAMGVFQDFENVIWGKPYTVGSYCLGTDGRNRIDTFYREYQITVAECVKQFGIENCSRSVKGLWKRGNTEAWVDIVHAVEPNDDRDSCSPMARDKAFRSVYYEAGARQDEFLKRSGFDEFPIMAPRWDITGEDILGTNCPGMDALGDTKSLQLGEKLKYKCLDMIANPPLQGDAALKNSVSGQIGPGDTIWLPDSNHVISPIYGNYRPDINAVRQDNMETEMRVKRAFYEDLFLMLANSDRRQITAREVAEKQEEKLLMLGPVLERLHAELLDPLIDRTFSILQGAGVLPPPPPELQEKELKVEYVSILAQAQRMVAVGGIERLTGFAAEIAQVWPDARHKIDPMQVVDEYAEAMGVNPRIVEADDKAMGKADAERQQAAQAQQQAAMGQMAQTAKTASEVDPDAVNQMLEQAGMQ